MATREYPRRHLVLLISILLVFIVSPAVATLRHGILFLNLVAATVLIGGSYALSARKHLFAVAIALSVISLIATALLLVFNGRWAIIASHTCDVALAIFFAITILGYVLSTGRVTADRIFAAICVYLLISTHGHLLTRSSRRYSRDPWLCRLRLIAATMSPACCT